MGAHVSGALRMIAPGVGAAIAPAVLQGALVALPRANALESLRRLRSPAWAAALPGAIVIGTFAPLGVPSSALGMILLGALATPPLAAVAVLAVARGPRAALIILALVAGVLALCAGGRGGQLSATAMTALGALAVGAALARLIPSRWVLAGFTCMCVLDVGLLAVGIGQPAGAAIARAAGHLHGPLIGHAQLGRVALDYPDLVLPAVLGAFLAGQQGQWCAAALVTVLAASCLLLAPPHSVWPATVPVAMTLIGLRVAGLPRRLEVTPLVPGPATV
jgi:hypothetical protein